MKKFILVFLTTILLFACNNDSKWNKEQEDLFMGGCVREAEKKIGKDPANKYCDCVLQKVKVKYGSYSALNKAIADDNSKMEELIKDCQPANPQ